MIASFPAAARVLMMAVVVALALAACGRRGPLEAPLTPAEAAAQRQKEELRRQRPGAAANPGDRGAVVGQTEIPPIATARRSEGEPPAPGEDDEDELPSNIGPSPVPTPTTRGGKRGYVIPRDPFILDPLL